MIVVALETSSALPSVAVTDGERRLESPLAPERAHASDLLPALDALLRELDRTPREIGAVAVGRGPGSYTGLRVGAAIALGLARASGARLVGIPSFEALAWRELAPGAEATLLLDARGGELYFARYAREFDGVRTLEAPRAIRTGELAGLVPQHGEILGGPGIELAAQLTPAERARLRSPVHPRASALLELALPAILRGTSHRPSEIEPLYLRAFAAVPRKR